ncbi:Na(+)-malate symporter [Dirofilaria immitis]
MHHRIQTPKAYYVPSTDVVTTIVLPTILFCIAMVIAMIIGINKCKQWELDKIVEMRRTRRVVQRITARLREKNFRTIQKARSMRQRKRELFKAKSSSQMNDLMLINNTSPPTYSINPPTQYGTSPPPSYEDALLDEFFNECRPIRYFFL